MAEEISKIESLAELEKEVGGEYQRWTAEIQAAEKELDKFRRKGRKIVKQFRADHMEVTQDGSERKFNLFAANVGILQTSLMNQEPYPSVNREFKDPQDDVARVACNIIERALSTHNCGSGHKSYYLFKQVLQDHLVPGVGVSWHTYHADIESRSEKQDDGTDLEYDEVVGEALRDEYVYWEDLVWSPARVWEEVRWIARIVYMTRDKLTKRFGSKGKKVSLDYNPRKSENSVETKHQVFQQARVYEIWDKSSKQVIWFSKGYTDGLLDKKVDFLNLRGFFPCPRFLNATVSNGQYVPIADYTYAQDQYRELNEINMRMALLVRACRVAGVYDKSSPQIAGVLNNAAENQLVPVDQWAAFAEKGGLKGVIDWVPLDQVVATLDQLLKNREDIKQQIYEITGMADIIRGATKASETLGAQKMKAQYASMRIQDRQKLVVEYTSDVFDIQAQLMRNHMGTGEIQRLAQVQFMAEDPMIIQQAFQLIKSPEFNLRARVEADTLSDVDFQAEKQDRMEYMTTITNYLKEMAPIIQQDQILGPFLMQLLQFSLMGFKIGKNFEAELDRTFAQIQQKLQQPQQPPADPEQQKVQAQIGLMQAQGQQDAQSHAEELQFKQKEHQLKLVQGAQELQAKQVEAAGNAQIKRQEVANNLQLDAIVHNQKMQMSNQRFEQQQMQNMAVRPAYPNPEAMPPTGRKVR